MSVPELVCEIWWHQLLSSQNSSKCTWDVVVSADWVFIRTFINFFCQKLVNECYSSLISKWFIRWFFNNPFLWDKRGSDVKNEQEFTGIRLGFQEATEIDGRWSIRPTGEILMNMWVAVRKEVQITTELGDQMCHAGFVNGTAQRTFGIVKVCQDFYDAVNLCDLDLTRKMTN